MAFARERLLRGCGVVLVLLVGSTVVQADDRQRALAAYREAMRQVDIGDFDHAMQSFKIAYREYEDPAFLFNVAQCYRLLNDDRNALQYLEAYARRARPLFNYEEVDRIVRSLRVTLEGAQASAPLAPIPVAPIVPRASIHKWASWIIDGDRSLLVEPAGGVAAAGKAPRKICGTMLRRMELAEAGGGDERKGRLVLARRELARIRAGRHTDVELGEGLYDVGNACDGLGNAVAAQNYFARAMALPAYRGSDSWAYEIRNLSLRSLWRKDYARAMALFREQLAFARKAGDGDTHEQVVAALEGLGETLVALRRGADAAVALDEALARFDSSSWLKEHRPGDRASLLRWRAEAAALVGDGDKAIAFIDQALGTGYDDIASHLAAAEIRQRFGRDAEARVSVRAARDGIDKLLGRKRAHRDDTDLAAEIRRLKTELRRLDGDRDAL